LTETPAIRVRTIYVWAIYDWQERKRFRETGMAEIGQQRPQRQPRRAAM
jgi:hypothetical protein